ncbi:MAG: hypothetical protein JW825_00385, partial [Candidatus Methanofastidiosa archaeon]|nr:hypothetical protein [Candidatus Methanofastidiosa archaeon]
SIRQDEFIVLFVVIIISSLFAYISLMAIGRMVLLNLRRINYFVLCIIGMAIQTLVIVALCGIEGLLLCSLATAMGMLPPMLCVNRSTLMGFLIVPVMIFYL